EAATFLKSHGREFWVVANKVDVPAVEPGAYEFAELGSDALFPVSCEHNLGFDELMEALAERIPAGKKTAEREIRVAIIGRPNVGKSSLVHRLLGEERVIVTSTPGTTRDAVDSQVTYHGRRFRIIDTAGIRRKGRTELMAEKLSVVMARKNIARADVVLLMIDASEGATKLDATIGGYAHDEGRPVVVLVNKWDLVEKDTQTMVRTEREYRSRMRFLDYAPMLFISARSGQRVHKVLEVAQRAHESSLTRVSTGELNQFLQREVGNMLERETSRKFFLKYACQLNSIHPQEHAMKDRKKIPGVKLIETLNETLDKLQRLRDTDPPAPKGLSQSREKVAGRALDTPRGRPYHDHTKEGRVWGNDQGGLGAGCL
ncbi:MAG: GTP-binding protein, partial [Acidobacteriota bacterium]